MVLRQGLVPVGAGLIVGALASIVVVGALSTLLVGVAPLDPVAFAAAVVTLVASSILACLIPAQRAARIEPVEAMRTE
jgi:ABC-type antimicrobial peptide transport system permease subunit